MARDRPNHSYLVDIASLPLDNHSTISIFLPSKRLHLDVSRSRFPTTQPDQPHTRSRLCFCLDAAMPTIPLSAMVLKNGPSIGSLLVSAGPGSDDCDLCGNSFEISASSKSTPIKLPCVDAQCTICARMWRILSSPICPACYPDFTCPKLARDRARILAPQLHLDANDTFQRQSPSDSQIESPLSSQKRYVAFHGADADSDGDTISELGSPMREEADEITAVSELSDEDLREALVFANNHAGTNFNIQEIRAEIPLADLRTGTKTQLADSLTEFLIWKTSESDEDDGNNESLQQPDEDEPSNATSQQDGATAWGDTFRCIHCQKIFRSAGHLRQHLVVHTLARCTCSICGRVLANANSRRVHEQRHQETEDQRDKRLRKANLAKALLRARQQG